MTNAELTKLVQKNAESIESIQGQLDRITKALEGQAHANRPAAPTVVPGLPPELQALAASGVDPTVLAILAMQSRNSFTGLLDMTVKDAGVHVFGCAANRAIDRGIDRGIDRVLDSLLS